MSLYLQHSYPMVPRGFKADAETIFEGHLKICNTDLDRFMAGGKVYKHLGGEKPQVVEVKTHVGFTFTTVGEILLYQKPDGRIYWDLPGSMVDNVKVA